MFCVLLHPHHPVDVVCLTLTDLCSRGRHCSCSGSGMCCEAPLLCSLTAGPSVPADFLYSHSHTRVGSRALHWEAEPSADGWFLVCCCPVSQHALWRCQCGAAVLSEAWRTMLAQEDRLGVTLLSAAPAHHQKQTNHHSKPNNLLCP